MPPHELTLAMQHHPPLYYGLYVIVILLIMILGYIIFDSALRYFRLNQLGKKEKLTFKHYKEIIEEPNLYTYQAPYGVENALIAFNSETPYILDVIETCIARNRHLIERYNNNEDPKVLATFLTIEIQLTTMIATSGINLMNRCSYYCQNCSKSFQVDCSTELIADYIKTAERLHDQFDVLKKEEFKTTEVLEISTTMYEEFFKFFETINSLLYLHENKNHKEEMKHD